MSWRGTEYNLRLRLHTIICFINRFHSIRGKVLADADAHINIA
jgi:hypothetical protein